MTKLTTKNSIDNYQNILTYYFKLLRPLIKNLNRLNGTNKSYLQILHIIEKNINKSLTYTVLLSAPITNIFISLKLKACKIKIVYNYVPLKKTNSSSQIEQVSLEALHGYNNNAV